MFKTIAVKISQTLAVAAPGCLPVASFPYSFCMLVGFPETPDDPLVEAIALGDAPAPAAVTPSKKDQKKEENGEEEVGNRE